MYRLVTKFDTSPESHLANLKSEITGYQLRNLASDRCHQKFTCNAPAGLLLKTRGCEVGEMIDLAPVQTQDFYLLLRVSHLEDLGVCRVGELYLVWGISV
jgi:hypothetical protein